MISQRHCSMKTHNRTKILYHVRSFDFSGRTEVSWIMNDKLVASWGPKCKCSLWKLIGGGQSLDSNEIWWINFAYTCGNTLGGFAESHLKASTLFAFVITGLSCIVECHIFSSTFLMLKKHFFFLFLEIIDIKWLSIKYPLGRSTNQMTLVHTEGLHIRMRITCWYVVPTCSSYADIPGILWCCSVQHEQLFSLQDHYLCMIIRL